VRTDESDNGRATTGPQRKNEGKLPLANERVRSPERGSDAAVAAPATWELVPFVTAAHALHP
jgi:hypothetical protein